MPTLTINLKEKSYPIYIEKGLFTSIGRRIKQNHGTKKIAVITDDNLQNLYGEKLLANLQEVGFTAKLMAVRTGEKSKSFDVLLSLYRELLAFNLTRGDLLITFGGGVVGDLGGFVAATFLRGIPFVQIPTSLLAQIDSSIGGKVAVNLPQGKNLVGSFYHPEGVYIDPDLLATLDERWLYDGMAEVIKYAAIRDKELFANLLRYRNKEELLTHIDDVIYTCCRIKKSIVEKDEKDLGERMLLNFGHTLGHAIEKYFNYEQYTHGQAVAIGMYNITKKGEALGETEPGTAEVLKRALEKYNLPYELPEMDAQKVSETMEMDKKNTGAGMNIVLLKAIGQGFLKTIERRDIGKYLFP